MASAQPSIEAVFKSIFIGYGHSFVKHVPPFTEEESGKVKAKFVGIAKYQSASSLHPSPPQGFEDGDNVPLASVHYEEHLAGETGLAISPLMDSKDVVSGKTKQNVVFWAVIDIDVYDVDFLLLIKRLYEYGYKFVPFISKSGGLHIYFFFSAAESAKEARSALNKIIEIFGLNKLFNDGKGKSRVEVFPQRDIRTPDVHEKCIMLPYYGGNKSNQKALSTEGRLLRIESAVENINSMFTSVKEIVASTSALPYSEAPYCIQMLLLSGALGSNSGRNEFLFTSAVYLRTKDGDAYNKADLEKMNSLMEEPLDSGEVNQIFNSAKETNYQLFGRCDKSPCADVCDRQLCRLRKYGVGKDKQNIVSNVEFGKIVRIRSEVPYYLWEARLSGQEDYKILRIDGAENLLNQKTIQKYTIDVLGQIALTVTQQAWENTVNSCLAQLEEREAPKATDTTELRELKDSFLRFLTHRRDKNNAPYTVNVKQVYYSNGNYYFKTDGFQEFLRSRAFKLGRVNLREELIRFGCEDGKLPWVNAKGEERIIDCWVKKEDDELRKLDTFYDDIHEADSMALMENPLNKKDQIKETQMEDVRF